MCEIVTDFIFGGSKITADGDCSHEVKRRLLFGRKVMTNPDSILKSRDITLQTKIMASGPITSSEMEGKTVETVQTLFFGAPKSL